MAGLSDHELCQELRRLGVDVGPITSTTRDVYVRKYRAMVVTRQQQKQPVATTSTPPLSYKSSKPAPQPTNSPRQQPAPPPPHPSAPPLTSASTPGSTAADRTWAIQDTTTGRARGIQDTTTGRDRGIEDTTTGRARGIQDTAAGRDEGIEDTAAGRARGVEDTAAAKVVEGLLLSFNNWHHIASDTAFLFPGGEVVLASRAILATQCSKMVPILYNNEVPYSVNVTTLSGQSSEFMVRGGEVVRDLKEKICLVHSIPLPQQRLIFKQQELPDTCTFRSLQILSGATLHLVLVASEMHSTPSYTCAGVNPTLSIHHFTIGLSSEQLACFTETPPLQQQITPSQSPPVTLPTHITHLVHAHDTLYSGFTMFLRYLYGRKLLQCESSDNKGSSGSQCGSYIMCYILGAYFELPELVGACITAIGGCLAEGNVNAVFEFSKSIQSAALQELCIRYSNNHNIII